MDHKVLPFQPTVTDKGGAAQAAAELEQIIKSEASQGWKFCSLQSMITTVKPTGCATLTNKEETTTIQLLIFQK